MPTPMISIEIHAFGCYLLVCDDGRDILIQTDLEFPSYARAFGWDGDDTDIAGATAFLDSEPGPIEDPGYFDGEEW